MSQESVFTEGSAAANKRVGERTDERISVLHDAPVQMGSNGRINRYRFRVSFLRFQNNRI